jgi:hypothetical protein
LKTYTLACHFTYVIRTQSTGHISQRNIHTRPVTGQVQFLKSRVTLFRTANDIQYTNINTKCNTPRQISSELVYKLNAISSERTVWYQNPVAQQLQHNSKAPNQIPAQFRQTDNTNFIKMQFNVISRVSCSSSS